MTNIKSQIKESINKYLSFNSIDEFVSVNSETDLVTNQIGLCYNDLTNLFATYTSSTGQSVSSATESQENSDLQLKKEAIQELVSQIFQQQHVKKQLLLLRLITKLVNNRVIEVRYVCEYMLNNMVYFHSTSLNSNYLNFLNNTNNASNQNQTNNLSISTSNMALIQKLIQKSTPGSKTTSTYLWCKILECIRRFIPLHDYKSCRDIFKMLLEVVKKISHSDSSYPPTLETELFSIKSARKHKLNDYCSDNSFGNGDYVTSLNTNNSNQISIVTDDLKLESLYDTISYLIDQGNYFMPRYLAINEIKTVLTFGKEAYHSRFHAIFTKFIESFIPTAQLISISGRDRLLPIVGYSNLFSLYSFWRFNQTTCKFNTSGPLPYFKHVSKPHHDVYFYLLRQNTSQYLILSLMSLHRGFKTRLHAFEEEFGCAIVDAMYLTEKLSSNTFENLRIWNNLVNQLVSLNQIIHLPALMQHLSSKIKKSGEQFKTSRDWLMWFLLLIITSYMNRNCPEFSDLYELLYKDEDVLPNPDTNSFASVINMAPLSIWIHLNLRMSIHSHDVNISNKSSSKISIIPEIIRNHYAFLQECLTIQSFQDYGLSICMNAYSTDTSTFTIVFNILLDKIGKSSIVSQQQPLNNTGIGSPSGSNSIFTVHQPLSFEMIASFTLHVRIHITTYLTYILTLKTSALKVLTLNIPASIVETFARFLIFDPDNFIKFLTQNVWQVLITTNLNSLPMPVQQHQLGASNNFNSSIQATFLYQQINLLIELICFRLKHLSFTHRTTFLYLLNNLLTNPSTLPPPNQNQQSRNDQINFIRHPQIYINIQVTMLKLLSSFSGSDFYELLNSIYLSSKHSPKLFINSDSEEMNKAIVMIVARAVHLTSSDLFPLENKEKDDALRGLLREIMKTTPIYFHNYITDSFPKVIQDFFIKEQTKTETFYADSSNKNYKIFLKKKVEEDYKRFLDCKHETQVQNIFTNNPISAHTLLCIFFNLLQDDSVQVNMSTYLSFILFYLNGSENKKITQSIRTLCDYLIIESNNQNIHVIDTYVAHIFQMINVYNIFTYDRFLFIMTFRSFDAVDYQLSLHFLHGLFAKNRDFLNKYNEFLNSWNTHCSENDEWNPNFYAQYVRAYPEKFFFEGIKEKINDRLNDTSINTYYGNMFMRCLPTLDFLNNRYIELNYQSAEADLLMDSLNAIYKFHNNPIFYVYNSLMYYNSKFDINLNNNNSKKKRLLYILSSYQKSRIPYFTPQFQSYLANIGINQHISAYNTPDISSIINMNYYYYIIQRLVKRMLDNDPNAEFNTFRSEFSNPSCHILSVTLCELMFLELFSHNPIELITSISKNIINMFLIERSGDSQLFIDKKEYVYWINAAGIIIANLPEPYWQPIYEILADFMLNDELLNTTEPNKDPNFLLDHFDLLIAEEKNIFNKLTLIITIFHSIWCHSSANHYFYFIKQFLKDRKNELVVTESQFLFICKLIGPFLSKIHLENTNLLIDLAHELYDMIHKVDKSNETLYYMETICNFFYHLKYRHIGESIKEKIHSLMPDFRPELKTQFKYITSELNQQLQLQQQQMQSLKMSGSSPKFIYKSN